MAAADVTRRLTVIGELCADIVVELASPPVFGQVEHLVPRTTLAMGSSSAITACGAARMSVPTSLVGVVGDDLLGRYVLDELRRHGVDTAHCRIDPSTPTGTSTILTLPGGDRSILTALGSIGTVGTDDVPPSLVCESAHVHVGSYFLQYALHENLGDFYRRCRSNGTSTSLDPNFDPSGAWASNIEAVLPETDVFFCNEQEAVGISQASSIDEAIVWFMSRLPVNAELVLKRGAEGARVLVGDGRGVALRYAAYPAMTAGRMVDTVGAGDNLAAGYLAARLRGLSIDERLRIGVRNGTASTRAAGGVQAQLTWAAATSA